MRSLLAALLIGLALDLAACSGGEGGSPGAAPPCQGDACPPVACTADERASEDGTCVPLGTKECAAGFVADAEGFGCREVLPGAACGPGTMPVLGLAACVPVGVEACTAGFERRADGWGCRAVVPPAACTGATRTALGSVTCVPVGDCAAPFPPAAAYFVDPAGAVDGAHFRTIGAALSAAPAGATIAVAAGTYAESIVPTKNVHVVGRCPAQVTLAPGAGGPGVSVSRAIDVEVSGVTITGAQGGVLASAGARVTLRDDVIDANLESGIVTGNNGTTVGLVRTVVRKTQVTPNAGSGFGITVGGGASVAVLDGDISENSDFNVLLVAAGAKATVEHSVVARALIGPQQFGDGLVARTGSIADVKTSAFLQDHDAAVTSFGAGTKVTMTDSTLEDTANGTEGFGRGAQVIGGDLVLERVTVSGNSDVGVISDHGTVTVKSSVIVGTKPSEDGGGGNGVLATRRGTVVVQKSALVGNQQAGAASVGAGAALTLEDSIVRDSLTDALGSGGFGLSVEGGSVAVARRSTFIANTISAVGAIDEGTKVTLASCVVTGTLPDARKRGGRALDLEDGAAAELTASAFVGNRDIALFAKGATLSVDQSVVRGTLVQESDGAHGRGIEAASGANVTVRRTSIVGNRAVGVFSSNGSSFTLEDSWIADTLADTTAAGAGRAATVQDATLTMTGVVAQRSRQAGVVAFGKTAALVMTSCRLEDVAEGAPGSFGHGIVATASASVSLSDVTVRRCASVGLVFDGSAGVVRASHIDDNAVGIFAQNGSELQQVDVAPDAATPGVVAVTADTSFTGNVTRVGSGVVSVPDPL
ncbi:MAG: hypothetical protein JWP97_4320 [Labilithrix sp.]|nr:hypothetical protein [Labilithrix sp.]